MDALQTSAMISNASTMFGEEDQIKLSAQKPVKGFEIDREENELDNDFFNKNYAKIKLNKGEKRALKLALKGGENLNEVEDLKTYL